MRVVLVLLMCALAGPAWADEVLPLSGVHVRVTFAPPRQALAVTVNLNSESGVGPNRTVAVDPDRSAWFGGLPEAEYVISVNAPGLVAFGSRVEVGAGEIVSVAVVVPASGEPTMSVNARWRHQEGARFAGALFEDLPSASDVWTLVETAAPFVIADRMDTGGLGTGRSALVGSRGESWAMTSVALGDALVRFPARTGQLPIAPAVNAIESVSVISGLAPVEVSTPGVHIRIAPKRPASGPTLGGDVSFTTPGMVGVNDTPGAPSIARVERWHQGGVFGGGPLTSGTGLFAAIDARRVEFTERRGARTVESRATTGFLHAVRRSGADHEIRVVGGFERVRAPFDGRRQFAETDVTARDTFGRLQVTWEHVGPSGTRRSISVGGQASRGRPSVSGSPAGGLVDRVLDGVVPPPPSADRRFQWNGRAEVSMAPARLGASEHGLRLGASVERLRAQSTILAQPVVAETVAGLPARVWIPTETSTSSTRGLTDAAVYVADRMAFGGSFVLDLGLRSELAYGSARGAEHGLRWLTTMPRLSFRWQPRHFAVFGGAGEYRAGNPMTLLTFGDPAAALFDVYRWADPNGNRAVEPAEIGILVARRGENREIASIDAGVKAPVSRELTIGAEWHPNARSTVGGAIIIRRTRRLITSVNDGVPVSAYRSFLVPDIGGDEGHPGDDQLLPIYDRLPASFGADRFRLTNADRPDTTYGGIELTWAISGARWNMLFGAMAYRTRGWGGDLGFGPLENDQLVIGERDTNPNAADDLAGSFFFDRSYVGKWTGTYRLPGDVRFGFAVRYQDGQPFTRYVIATDLAGGPELVHAYRVGRTRFTYTATVDTRFEKGVTIRGARAAIRFDVFNLTNHANEVEEDVVSGPLFRRSTATQPPRTFRLGLTFGF